MRRTLATLGVLGLFAACGFPDVTYQNGAGDDGGSDAKSQGDAPFTGEGSGGDDARDGTTGNDGASSGGDASESGDATSSGDSQTSEAGGDASGSDSSTGADTGTDGPGTDGDAMPDGATDAPQDAVEEQPVDAGSDAPVCDKDGDHDLAKGAVCGGTDCDDNDARAYFGEPSFLTFTPTPVTNGDWNCDGVVTPQFATGFSCGVISLGSCGAASGFTDTPGCGVTSANFITCRVQAAVLCVTNTTSSNTQGCK
jgi:hypothetical protein